MFSVVCMSISGLFCRLMLSITKPPSLLKNSIAEFTYEERRRKSLSYGANSKYFSSKIWYFAI